VAEGWVLPGRRGGAGVGRPVSAFPRLSFLGDRKDWFFHACLPTSG
jgi:hypothetical protein